MHPRRLGLPRRMCAGARGFETQGKGQEEQQRQRQRKMRFRDSATDTLNKAESHAYLTFAISPHFP
jgi:hypothetical protein